MTKKPVKVGSAAWRRTIHEQPEWVEMQRIVPLSEACRLSNLSKGTIKRRFADKILHLSPRRLGMRLCDALELSES
jgi:hypothetical protein